MTPAEIEAACRRWQTNDEMLDVEEAIEIVDAYLTLLAAVREYLAAFDLARRLDARDKLRALAGIPDDGQEDK